MTLTFQPVGGHGRFWRSYGNGTVIELVSGTKSVTLQGDDAVAFLERIETTNDRYTDSDVVAEYEGVMQ
jgi:hypothetical protein